MLNKVIFLIFLGSSISSFSQTAYHDQLTKKGNYSAYLTKDNSRIMIGDTLTIGLPSTDFGFMFITQGNQKTTPALANTKVVVDKLKTFGNKKRGFKMYAQFKGYGMLPVMIDIETALQTGELQNITN